MTADHQTDQKHVKIKYRSREQFRSFHNRKQRWSVLVCHRRAGKTVATLNDLIRGAVNECKPEGRYALGEDECALVQSHAIRTSRRKSVQIVARRFRALECGAALTTSYSLRLRPTICSPTGMPSPAMPAQTVAAGWPVRLNG
jgi:hypothetical protein